MTTIALVDYGSGNLRSVEKALCAAGASVQLARSAAELETADKIVLPGVGAFGDCMRGLAAAGLVPALLALGLLAGALLLSSVGDYFLALRDNPGNFVRGLGAFLGAHLCYLLVMLPFTTIPHASKIAGMLTLLALAIGRAHV